jgi:hypothetical protein
MDANIIMMIMGPVALIACLACYMVGRSHEAKNKKEEDIKIEIEGKDLTTVFNRVKTERKMIGR